MYVCMYACSFKSTRARRRSRVEQRASCAKKCKICERFISDRRASVDRRTGRRWYIYALVLANKSAPNRATAMPKCFGNSPGLSTAECVFMTNRSVNVLRVASL